MERKFYSCYHNFYCIDSCYSRSFFLFQLHSPSPSKLYFINTIFTFFIVISFTTLYLFPLQATFINEPLTIIKNSFLTALKHFPYTVALFISTYIPLAITWLFPQIFFYTFAYWLLIGCSICAICSVCLTKKVFRNYMD